MAADVPVYPALKKRSGRGFRGYPAATIAFYGSDNVRASKVAVGIVPAEGAEPSEMRRWTTTLGDIRRDPVIGDEIIDFIRRNGAETVVMSDGILGCPHEEGIDYPDGQPCPQCPFWEHRDRFTHDPIT